MVEMETSMVRTRAMLIVMGRRSWGQSRKRKEAGSDGDGMKQRRRGKGMDEGADSRRKQRR
ncbi:hypothetical protein CDL15_Pgr017660 [Punica granatum]|uniref:Uncharacterized protein n=1 Tax=Punica granatum TaxID=22663 RepID=A0A218XPC1_PUNGR|nr:hypothetical protein CDL15_Pgr017660 [Punica granatum]